MALFGLLLNTASSNDFDPKTPKVGFTLVSFQSNPSKQKSKTRMQPTSPLAEGHGPRAHPRTPKQRRERPTRLASRWPNTWHWTGPNAKGVFEKGLARPYTEPRFPWRHFGSQKVASGHLKVSRPAGASATEAAARCVLKRKGFADLPQENPKVANKTGCLIFRTICSRCFCELDPGFSRLAGNLPHK